MQAWSREQILVLLDVGLCVVLWATRDLSIGPWPAWSSYFDGNVSNGTVGLFCTVMLFVLPGGSMRPRCARARADSCRRWTAVSSSGRLPQAPSTLSMHFWGFSCLKASDLDL